MFEGGNSWISVGQPTCLSGKNGISVLWGWHACMFEGERITFL